MNTFTQLIRFENSEANKERVIEFIKNLHTAEKLEHEVIVRPYKLSKTDEQRGYYFSTVVPVAMEFQGLVSKHAHVWLKEQCCEPVYFSTLAGETYKYKPSIKDMKINIMSKYIDDCINLLGVEGQYVPPPTYKVK